MRSGVYCDEVRVVLRLTRGCTEMMSRLNGGALVEKGYLNT